MSQPPSAAASLHPILQPNLGLRLRPGRRLSVRRLRAVAKRSRKSWAEFLRDNRRWLVDAAQLPGAPPRAKENVLALLKAVYPVGLRCWVGQVEKLSRRLSIKQPGDLRELCKLLLYVVRVIDRAYHYDPSPDEEYNEARNHFDRDLSTRECHGTAAFLAWADAEFLDKARVLLAARVQGTTAAPPQVGWAALRGLYCFSDFCEPVEVFTAPLFQKLRETLWGHVERLASRHGRALPSTANPYPSMRDALGDLIDRVINWCSELDGALATAEPPPDGLERGGTQEDKGERTAPSMERPANASPTGTNRRRKRSECPDKHEVNMRVGRYLEQHQGAPIREVAKAVDSSTGTVAKTDNWEKEMVRRNAAKGRTKKEPRPLTPEMLVCIGTADNIEDVDAGIDARDAAWRQILEEAPAKQRAKLHKLNEHERQKLIEKAMEKYADRLTGDGR